MDQTERGTPERNKLRGAIAEMELRVRGLSAKGEPEGDALRVERVEATWKALLALIQLEPEPTRRPCPHCHGRMRQNATRCLYCYGKSEPPGAETAGAA